MAAITNVLPPAAARAVTASPPWRPASAPRNTRFGW